MYFPEHILLSLESQEILVEAARKAKELPADSLHRKKLIERAIEQVKQHDAGRFIKKDGGR